MKIYINIILYFLILCIPYANTFNYQHIPIQEQGRIKPLDSFARNQLLKFNGKTSLTIYDNNVRFKLDAIDWLMPILLQDPNSLNIPVFKIENPDVTNAIKLEWREKSTYSYNEINDGLNYIDNSINNPQLIETLKIRNRNNGNSLDLIDKQLLDLSHKRDLFNQLYYSASFLIPNIHIEAEALNLAKLLQVKPNQSISYIHLFYKIQALLIKAEEQSQDKQSQIELLNKLGFDKAVLEEHSFSDLILMIIMQQVNIKPPLLQSDILKIFPTKDTNNPWLSINQIAIQDIPEYFDMIIALESLFKSHIEKQSIDIQKINKYQHIIFNDYDVNTNLLIREANYNKANLFYWSLIFYILSFISAIILIIIKNLNSKLKIIPVILLIIGFLYNTSGLIIRMTILNRPPVSTLYESVIFVAFIAVLLAIILEIIKRDNFGLLIGSLSGIILHYISFGYASDGDTFGVLVAVLNSNFWLATHVTTITTGYGTTIIASLVGHLYLLKAAWNSNKEELKSIFNIMLATTFIALFFTMFGTILGGIWGDQSWGRFWGWDPKENGALLIVMWLLMMLHLKISGWVKGAGYALGLVLANITVALAWFGVNLLNVGLHNYGFTEGAAFNLLLFIVFEILFGVSLYIKVKSNL